MATVLVVDRDPFDLEHLTFLFKQGGHKVLTASDANTAGETLAKHNVELVAVETSGEPADGIRLCQRLRQLDPYLPMIIVSDRTGVEQVVHGLASVADDYVRKPFFPQELLARVTALLRRAGLSRMATGRDETIKIGEITLDQQHLCAVVNGTRVRLTPRELSLLRAFMENPDRVLTREQLLEMAWDSGVAATAKVIDVYVLRLRRKLQAHLDGEFYVTALRGFGYMFGTPQVQRPPPDSTVLVLPDTEAIA